MNSAPNVPPCEAWTMANIGIQNTVFEKIFSFENSSEEGGRVLEKLSSMLT